MPRHVVITGPMGAGKSTLATTLADQLGRPFLDNDSSIEAQHGKTGRAIAAEKGVPYLHGLELDFLEQSLAGRTPAVIAAAASVADDAALLGRIISAGHLLVFLEVDPDDLESLGAGAHRRPLPQGEARRLYGLRHRAAVAAGALVLPLGDQTIEPIVAALGS